MIVKQKSKDQLVRTIYSILLLLLLPIVSAYAQKKHAFFLSTGYTNNTSIKLKGQTIGNSQGYLFTLGGVKKLISYKDHSFELGFALKTIFTSGQIDDLQFNASTLRVTVPVRFVFSVAEKWQLATGFIIQNNEDLNTLDWKLRNKYDWRYDVFGEIKFFFKKDWFLTTSGNFNLKKMPDPFFINDPKAAFSIGIGKNILIVNKRKKARKEKRRLKRKNKKNKL